MFFIEGKYFDEQHKPRTQMFQWGLRFLKVAGLIGAARAREPLNFAPELEWSWYCTFPFNKNSTGVKIILFRIERRPLGEIWPAA